MSSGGGDFAVVDFDDFHEFNHKLDRLHALKAINPAFRCTLFAVPGLGSRDFWEAVPDWCELAVHGWKHPNPYEAKDWTYTRTLEVLDEPVVRDYFVNGFKAPGWQISDFTYQALLDQGWWVADQHLEDARRPAALPVYFYEAPGRWHGHIQDWGSNGIDETWGDLVHFVMGHTEFRFCSEALS